MANPPRTSSNGLPVVQGIELIPTSSLPDRLRTVFPYPLFNAIQSASFQSVFKTDDNFVLSAPTGSGKTTILDLAVCRLFTRFSQDGRFKVIYMAPTKALCSERQVDWSRRFSGLGLKVMELTGDTEGSETRAVAGADLVVTTPEKWDSITRKWRDHAKLIELVRLFLIDEVHILKEDRGAILEAVVSRMKSVGTGVRFVALSATVPNVEDIAAWLARNGDTSNQPAGMKVFGEEFRPVRFQKHVVGLQCNGNNDWQFEKTCNKRLPDIIAEFGAAKKPLMVFCMTRKSSEETASLLAQWFSNSQPAHRFWQSPMNQVNVKLETLRKCITSGVAFHHAGLDLQDRIAIEKAYVSGDINVICCTSTLAVGVNLPCHFVIIKNTVSYQGEGLKEYSDLEVMQMLGRAGRPQFDHSAIAVIITTPEKVDRYKSMVMGQQILESRLHDNLIEHLNSEIGLGTIHNKQSATAWLRSTFFFVRYQKNPQHYKIFGMQQFGNVDDIVQQVCGNDIKMLMEASLIEGDEVRFQGTGFGDAMARYYIQFSTMELFMSLPVKPKISEILSVLAQAAEYSSIRLKQNERNLYKEINKSPQIKFPIKVELLAPGHKISLIIQAVLGGFDTSHDERFANNQMQFQQDLTLVFQHIHRLIRCIIDCQLHLADSAGARNALELARSLGAKAWDDSPLQLQQLEKIGPVSCRKLIAAGIKNIEDLEHTESQKIDMILNKNPPFGALILDRLKSFPKLRISLRMMGTHVTKDSAAGKYLRIHVKAELGFLNDKPPVSFMHKAVHVILLAETSDGRKIHFLRSSAHKIGNGQDIDFTADLTSPQQIINCYVSCDNIVGTLRHASLHPKIPVSAFPANASIASIQSMSQPAKFKQRHLPVAETQQAPPADFDDFELDDSDLIAADDVGFEDIDELDRSDPVGKDHHGFSKSKAPAEIVKITKAGNDDEVANTQQNEKDWKPEKLSNGKWECKHACKNKRTCKHTCCREGLDNPPKPPKPSKKEENSSVATKDKQKQKKATDFLDQAKPTMKNSAGSTYKGLSTATQRASSATLIRPSKSEPRPRYQPSPTDDSSCTIPDEDLLNLPDQFTTHPSSYNDTTVGGHSFFDYASRLFVSDSSSPYKGAPIAQVELSNTEHATKRSRPMSSEYDLGFDYDDELGMQERRTKKKIMSTQFNTERSSRSGFITLADLEKSTAITLPSLAANVQTDEYTAEDDFGTTEQISSANIETFNPRSDHLLQISGALAPHGYGPFNLRNTGSPGDDLIEEHNRSFEAIVASHAAPEHELSGYGLTQKHNHSFDALVTKHSTPDNEFAGAVDGNAMSNDVSDEVGAVEDNPPAMPEGIDPWLIEQFGAYVDFI